MLSKCLSKKKKLNNYLVLFIFTHCTTSNAVLVIHFDERLLSPLLLFPPLLPTLPSLPPAASPDLEWLWNQDASRDLLLAVHPPNYIVLWNGDTGTKLWKKSYAENILSFSFDPFDPSNMARTCPHSSPPRAPRSANSTTQLGKP